MNYFVNCALLNAITSILICTLVILNNPQSKTNRTFAYYAFSVAIWAGFQFLWITANNKSDALLYCQISLFSAIFISSTFFHFTCHLINDYKKHARIIKYLYIYGLAMFPFVLTPLFIADIKSVLLIQNWPLAGKIFIFFVLEYTLVVGYSLHIIFKKLKSTNGIQHQQLKYIFYGILAAYIGGLTNFPLCYNIPILPFGNIFVSIYTVFITYAIYKYQLMNINIIIKRSLVYTILITFITLFYFLSTYLTEHVFQAMFGYKSLLISMISATTIALAFIPLRNLIQNFIEKFLFKGSFVEIAEQNDLLREEVIQTEKLKSIAILASGMAHEIKNPLTVLKTFAEYLPHKLEDKDFLRKFAPMITQEVNRIDNLVHELLEFARPAAPILKPVNIHGLINSTVELMSNEYIKHHIGIHKEYRPSKDILLDLDYNQIKQALLNILLNAIEAMPDSGQLYISTQIYSSREIFQIKIQDTGIGIYPQDLAHIFDPFFTKKDAGTGLGLSITYEIIKKHGGKIFVESVPGKGTSFILEFPFIKQLH